MEITVESLNLNRITAVYKKLKGYVEKYENERDSRAIFTYVYCIMTKTIEDNFISANFDDPESMMMLTETFAGFYFSALESYDKNKIAPRGWQKAFDTISMRKTSVMEDMVISMYVHIVQDLAFAVCELNNNKSQNHIYIGDYHKVNDILQKTINTIQDDVAKRYDPYMHWLDVLVKKEALIFTNYGIRLARSMSWYNAHRMMDEKLKDAAIASIEKSIKEFIEGIKKNHSWFVRIIFNFLRFFLNLSRKWRGHKIEIKTKSNSTFKLNT